MSYIVAVLSIVALTGVKANNAKLWMNRDLSPNARAKLLLPELSLQEKIAMTWATHTSEKTAMKFNATGVGAVKFMSAFSCGSNMEQCVSQRNDLQRLFMNSSAHGIPISFINEGLHGGASGGTIFPEPIGQSMSWNRTLVTAITSAIAKTASAIGVDMVFAPVVNMMPDPRFGRLQEGFGENPTIASELGAAAVTGLQGFRNGPEHYRLPEKVGSLGKHYAAYGAAIGGLNGGPADVSNRTLHEIYLRPWMALAREGVRAVMPAHQTVHDIPAHGNGWLIDTTLRNTFGFGNGIALSDCNDVGAIYDARFAANQSEAAALALKAGVDWDLQCGGDPVNWGYGNGYLEDALASGLVEESVLDAVVLRVLQQKFAANLFDSPYVPVDGVNALLDNPAHRQLAREAAEQSAVLLKNTNNALPLTLRGKKVAVFGGLAEGGEAQGAMEGSYTLDGAHTVSVAEAIQNASVVGAASVTVLNTCNPQGTVTLGCTNVSGIAAAASVADVNIIVVGDTLQECGEWGDRDSLEMSGSQLQLIDLVANASAHGTPVVVVMLHGRPQTFGPGNAALDKIDALLSAWRPGEEGGNAIVNLLTGVTSPSGKLAQSWPQTVGQVGGPSVPWLQRVRGKWVSNHRGCIASEGRCYSPYTNSEYGSTPLFPFGFGLSYTTFSYVSAVIKPSADIAGMLAACGALSPYANATVWTVAVTLNNSGSVAATEIVEVYIQDPSGLPFVPFWRRLVGFERIHIAPGATATVAVPIMWSHLAQYDENMTFRLFSGTYSVYIGGSSADTPLAYNATLP
eukprot:m.184813 g.184813  ORF g.184813 m.184813 type:complete len:797 (-) comp18490_c0_seq2:182-2572(-)